MQEELLQFKMRKVWILVDLSYGKRAIGTKWVYRNKNDENGIMVKKKARLAIQGHSQKEGIDYKEVFAPIALIEAIRLFLAYASFMFFMVYQMDVKSAFLYGTIKEEVYFCQPPGFKDPDYPDIVYKVVKALYGFHQTPRAWYETLVNYLLENGFQRDKIDQTLFIKRQKEDILLVEIYVDDIIFGKSATTPIDTEKPLLKDPDGEDVDVHTYRSMIGSLMYLTSSRTDSMFSWLERRNKVRKLKFRRLQRVGTSQRVETSDETVFDDVSNQGRMIAKMDQDHDVVLVLEDDKEEDREFADAVKDVEEAKVDESAQDQGRQAESQAKIYKIDMDHTHKVLSMPKDDTEPAKVQEVVYVVTSTKLITEVVTTTSAIITAIKAQVPTVTLHVAPARVAAAPKEPKTLKKKQQIKQDEQYARELQAELNKNIDWDKAIEHVKRKAKVDHAVKRYQLLKSKPQTEAQARKNMMMYLKNVDGFKMDYFKGMSYDDIRLIFEAKFNSNVAFLLKIKDQIKEDENRALKRLNETPVERVAKRQKIDEEVEELTRHLQIVTNEDDDMYLKNVDGFKMDYFKGMSYDDIRLIFEAKFNSNVAFLLKIKDQIKEDENRALKRLNETPVERVAKRQKIDEEVEELTRHLQIVTNEDDDVYTEATSLA
nr:putative ribonuclease H-like domain-containing protein [Tanacetum cinerariifolium]